MEHRCRRGSYCPEFEQLNDGTRAGAAINATEGLCGVCERHVERALADLPRDYVVLNTLLGKGSTAGGEPIRMTKELPIPIKVHVEALQRDMVREAMAWACSVAEVLNVRFAVHGGVRPGWLLSRSCALLSGAPSAFLALRDCKHTRWEYGHRVVVARDGLDGALNLLRLHQKARAYTGQTRLVHRLPVPCPRCEAMALEREDGTDTIDCTDCLRRYTWAEYEKLCLILAGRSEAGVA
jgi:hypothetical protein